MSPCKCVVASRFYSCRFVWPRVPTEPPPPPAKRTRRPCHHHRHAGNVVNVFGLFIELPRGLPIFRFFMFDFCRGSCACPTAMPTPVRLQADGVATGSAGSARGAARAPRAAPWWCRHRCASAGHAAARRLVVAGRPRGWPSGWAPPQSAAYADHRPPCRRAWAASAGGTCRAAGLQGRRGAGPPASRRPHDCLQEKRRGAASRSGQSPRGQPAIAATAGAGIQMSGR